MVTSVIRMLVLSLLLTFYLSSVWFIAFFFACQTARVFRDHLVQSLSDACIPTPMFPTSTLHLVLPLFCIYSAFQGF